MRRNLRFWSQYSAKVIVSILGLLLLLEVLSCLFGNGVETFAGFVSELWILLPVSASLILLMISNGMQTTYIPLVLSHGQTRRNVFLGCTAARLAICTIIILISIILAFISGEEWALRALPTEILVLLSISAFGGIISMLFLTVKWLAFPVMVLIFAVYGGALGYLTTCSGGAGWLISALQEALQTAP